MAILVFLFGFLYPFCRETLRKTHCLVPLGKYNFSFSEIPYSTTALVLTIKSEGIPYQLVPT